MYPLRFINYASHLLVVRTTILYFVLLQFIGKENFLDHQYSTVIVVYNVVDLCSLYFLPSKFGELTIRNLSEMFNC